MVLIVIMPTKFVTDIRQIKYHIELQSETQIHNKIIEYNKNNFDIE